MLRIGEQSFTLRDVARVLFRHKKKAILFFLVTNLVALGAVLLQPKKYLSEAKLFVRLGKESIGVDPTAATGQTIGLSQTRESEIATVQNILNSRTLFEQVVDQIGTDAILADGGPPSGVDQLVSRVRSELLGLANETSRVKRDLAIQKFGRTIEIENPRKSHVFYFAYKSQSPELSQHVLNTYLDICRKHYSAVNHSDASYDFFVVQTERLRKELDGATRELGEAKSRMNVVSIEGERKVYEDHVGNLHQKLLTSKADLAAAQGKLTALREKVASDEALAGAASSLSVKALDDMRNQLYGLQLRERELLASFSPSHPRVEALRRQVKEANELLRNQEFIVEQSKVAELSAQVNSLETQHKEAFERLRHINAEESNVLELQRRVDQLDESYRLYMRNKEQALIDQELQSQRITNLADAQLPTLAGKSQSRMGVLIMTLAVLAGAIGSVGLAFLCESLDDSLRNPRDIERSFGVPVLLSMPSTRSPITVSSAQRTARTRSIRIAELTNSARN